jgi:hypothetical protein
MQSPTAASASPHQKTRARAEPAVASEPASAEWAEPAPLLEAAFTWERPAAGPAARPWQTAQRQAAAARLGRQLGNRQVQRFVAPVAPRPAEISAQNDPAVQDELEPGAAPTVQRSPDSAGQSGGVLARLQQAANSFLQGIAGRVNSAVQWVQSGWQGVTQQARSGLAILQDQGGRLMGTVASGLGAIASSITWLDSAALTSAWNRLRGLVSSGRQALQSVGTQVSGALQTAWSALSHGATAALGALGRQVSAFFSQQEKAAADGQAQTRTWWQRAAGAVTGLVSGLWQRIKQRVVGVWQGLQNRAASAWRTARSGWQALRGQVTGQVGKFVSGAVRLVGGLTNLPFNRLIDVITRVGPLFRAAREALRNPDALLAPVVAAIVNRLAGVLGRAGGLVQDAVDSRGRSLDTGRAGGVVMRQPETVAPVRTRASAGEILDGVGEALKQKWRQLDIREAVKSALWTLIIPWRGLGDDVAQMTQQLQSRGRSLFAPRRNSLGEFVADVLSNLSKLLEFPLVLWRMANNIAGRFYGWFFILSMLVGGIAGAVGGTVGGAILTFMAGGAGAAPGAGVGLVGGAGIGIGFALAVGEALLYSFIGAESATLLNRVLHLFTTEQVEAEKRNDYGQIADSGIGLAAALILMVLSGIGARIASRLSGLVRRLPVSIQQGLRRLGSGVRRGYQGTRQRIRQSIRPSNATARRLGIDMGQLEKVGEGVYKPRGAKSPTREEIALAERLARQAGDEIIFPRAKNQEGIDGFYRRSGQPIQLKTLRGGASGQTSKVVTRANEAYASAQKHGWHNVDLHIESPSLTQAEVLARWNASNATPAVKPMPGDHIGRITVHCSDGLLSLPVPVAPRPVLILPLPGQRRNQAEQTVETAPN